jgi:hypothetical protein
MSNLKSFYFKSPDEYRNFIIRIIETGNNNAEYQNKCLRSLKLTILANSGLPPDEELPFFFKMKNERRKVSLKCSIRAIVWKIFLCVGPLSVENYLSLLVKSEVYDKINYDLPRTVKLLEQKDIFYNKQEFIELLSRILNAFANNQTDKENYSYVQGMNWLCGIFCIIMPELDSFYAFSQVASYCVPTYLNKSLSGVNSGCELLATCLNYIDEDLHKLFSGKNKVYFLPQLLSLFTINTPISEVLKIWDFLISHGFYLCILVLSAILVQDKTAILTMREDKLSQYFTCIANIQAGPVIRLAYRFIKRIPRELHEALVKHTHVFVDGARLDEKLSSI